MEVTAIIRKGEKQYVALCPEVDVVSQGFTVEEALKNLKEAVDLYIEEMGVPETGVGEESRRSPKSCGNRYRNIDRDNQTSWNETRRIY